MIALYLLSNKEDPDELFSAAIVCETATEVTRRQKTIKEIDLVKFEIECFSLSQ